MRTRLPAITDGQAAITPPKLLPITMRSYNSPKLLFRGRLARRRSGTVLDHDVADDGDRTPGRGVGGGAFGTIDRDLFAEQTDLVLDRRNHDADVFNARRRHRLHAARSGAAADPIEEVGGRTELT